METVIDIPAEHEANVFGQFDAYAKKIERALHVTLIARGESVKIMGDALKVEKAKILSAIPYRENRSSRRHSVRKNTSMQSVNR